MKYCLCYLIVATAFVAATSDATPRSLELPGSTKRVSVGSLDLADRHDRGIFDARIRTAARAICEELNGAYSGVVSECVLRSVRQARAQRDEQVARHVRSATTPDGIRGFASPIG